MATLTSPPPLAINIISLEFMTTFIGMAYACMFCKIFQPHTLNPNLGQAHWLPFRMLLVAMLQTGSPIVLSGAEFNGC
jgi:hypothetical protein